MTDPTLQTQRADDFLALHHADEPLLLANAWDVISARICELEGYRAIGTTSAGISSTLGYPDMQCMSLEENLQVVGRIVGHVDLPVSADIEAGYAESTEGVVQAARAVLDIGAVGLNLEDSPGEGGAPLLDVSKQAERIGSIRSMASAAGIHLVINARTDVYMFTDDAPAEKFRHAIRRARAYVQAGADCVFVPDLGDLDRATIAALVREIPSPLNVIAGAQLPCVRELAELGVARLSVGPRPMRAALSAFRDMARELIRQGTYDLMSQGSISYADVNGWLERPGAEEPA